MDDNYAPMCVVADTPAAVLAVEGLATELPNDCPEGGYELFRRAVCERDDTAWAALIDRYRRLVFCWVRQHPNRPVSENDDFWVTRTFERFWAAVGPARFEQFPNVAALMRYLKLCTHSVVMDEARVREARQIESLDALPATHGPVAHDAGALAARRIDGQALWAGILQLVTDDSERLIIFLSFARDLKPGQIYERYPQRFRSVSDVYRVKRNVLERLRRDPHIREFLQ